MSKLSSCSRIPNLYDEVELSMYQGQSRYLMKMDLLGPDLGEILESEQKQGCKIFTVKTSCNLGQQMVRIIKDVHSQEVLHRDIKPANFCISKDASPADLSDGTEKIYLIDFGLSKSYTGRHGKHIPMLEEKKLVGTPRYCSLATHMGYEQSRRDDMEVIGNTLIYLLKGELPWEDCPKATNKWEQNAIIAKKVKDTTLEELCDGLPAEIYKFMQHCRALKFEEQPNYKLLIKLLEECKNNSNPVIIEHNKEKNNVFLSDQEGQSTQ